MRYERSTHHFRLGPITILENTIERAELEPEYDANPAYLKTVYEQPMAVEFRDPA